MVISTTEKSGEKSRIDAKGNIAPRAFDDRRSGNDRRDRSKRGVRFLLFGGRRVNYRRHADRQRMLYVDWYHQSLFGTIVLILLLSVMDALLTIVLINHGATEINPIMAFYLEMGPYTFLFVKYGLTCAGLLILVLCNNFFLRSIRVHAGALLYLVLVAFIGVVSWQIFLIGKIIA